MDPRNPRIPFGTRVTVRVMITMPGKHEGQILQVEWGPEIAMLVRRGRYELVPPYPGSDRLEPTQPDEPPSDPPAGDDTAATEAAATLANQAPKRRRRTG